MPDDNHNDGAVIIFYYAPDREVMWEDESESGRLYQELFPRLQDFIVNGHIFEILEFHPNGISDNAASERAHWWDEQLHNLGYDVPYIAEDGDWEWKEQPHA